MWEARSAFARAVLIQGPCESSTVLKHMSIESLSRWGFREQNHNQPDRAYELTMCSTLKDFTFFASPVCPLSSGPGRPGRAPASGPSAGVRPVTRDLSGS